MRCALRLTMIGVLLGTPVAAEAAEPRLDPAHPTGLVVDGQLGEWTAAPALEMGPGSRVAGKSDVSGPDDFSLRGWWALSPEGLAVAGEVRDDALLFPTGESDLLSSDHLELWIALPPAEMPPVGYINQFGDVWIETAEDCEGEGTENPEGCKAWFERQQWRRVSLGRVFVRQYVLSPRGVAEVYASERAEVFPEVAIQPTACKAAFREVEGGYHFEALIPLQDFPATAQLPLTGVRLLLDAVDNDAGRKGQESFLSSSSKRRWARPETFHEYTLAEPIVTESDPPLVQDLLKRYPSATAFYRPGERLEQLFRFENLAEGYQYSPGRDSPEITVATYGVLERIATLGDVDVYLVPMEDKWRAHGSMPQGLVSMRDGAALATRPTGHAELVKVVQRDPGLHLILQDVGTQSYLGTGACGACAQLTMAVVGMSADGQFEELFAYTVGEQGSHWEADEQRTYTLEEVEMEVGDDGSTLTWRATEVDNSGEETVERPFVRRFVWNPDKRQYLRDESAK